MCPHLHIRIGGKCSTVSFSSQVEDTTPCPSSPGPLAEFIYWDTFNMTGKQFVCVRNRVNVNRKLMIQIVSNLFKNYAIKEQD